MGAKRKGRGAENFVIKYLFCNLLMSLFENILITLHGRSILIKLKSRLSFTAGALGRDAIKTGGARSPWFWFSFVSAMI